ncbi:MAG: UTP--glucose-1-phosphate uridylyltransferase GalU [Patescibacteria group bacterium]
MKIKKAIIPVAGMGTRFLPATKAQPKEMLPVVDKPVIQYIVEEAVSAGIESIIFVTSLGKRAIEDHFDRNFELEYRLRQKDKKELLDKIKSVESLADFAFVRQNEPKGDGHALLSAAPLLGDEPVAVLFGDDIIDMNRSAIGELIETYERLNAPVLAVQKVAKNKVSQYGVIDGEKKNKKEWLVNNFIEKPEPKEAPTTEAVVGRYVITPEILNILKTQKPGKGGEIRLADAFITYISKGGSLYARAFDGVRYDCGSKFEFVMAQIELGLKHPEIKKELSSYLKKRFR